jgi:hypothetical protein
MPGRDEISKMSTTMLIDLHRMYGAYLKLDQSLMGEPFRTSVSEGRTSVSEVYNYIHNLLKYRATCAQSELNLIPEGCGGLRKS